MSIATFRLALRVLLRRKVFTAISLFGVTLTLLVLIVATSLADATIAPQPPESASRRALYVVRVRLEGENASSTGAPGPGLLERTVRDMPGAEEVTVFRQTSSETAWVDGRKVPAFVKRTDGAFWRIHDFTFVEGAPYDDEDDAAGRAVAVISESMRDGLFGGASALGRTFELDGRAFRVGGVVRDVSFLRYIPFGDVFVPLGTLPGGHLGNMGIGGSMSAVILARDAADIPRIQAEYHDRAQRVPMPDSTYTVIKAEADTHFQALARKSLAGRAADSRDPGARLGMVLAALAVGFMLLPALNLVNLSLSRVLERASEIGVRKAFGATRGQIVMQFVAENVLLTVIGGVLAAALAPFVLMAIDASGVIPGSDLSVNGRVLALGLVFAVVFGILSGAWPAWRMSRLPPVDVLRGRTS